MIRDAQLTHSQHQPHMMALGYQVQVVDYRNPASIQHALRGVDTVISTVTGSSQLALIEAAVRCRVRRFAPAEFEGRPSQRPQNDPLDRGRAAALSRLQYYRRHMESTTFVCGILYERFAVGGLAANRIGLQTGFANEGDYIVNARSMVARAPVYNERNAFSQVCLTSAYDVARFVVRAIDMQRWPAEMTMWGERMTVSALVTLIQECRGMIRRPIVYLKNGLS